MGLKCSKNFVVCQQHTAYTLKPKLKASQKNPKPGKPKPEAKDSAIPPCSVLPTWPAASRLMYGLSRTTTTNLADKSVRSGKEAWGWGCWSGFKVFSRGKPEIRSRAHRCSNSRTDRVTYTFNPRVLLKAAPMKGNERPTMRP